MTLEDAVNARRRLALIDEARCPELDRLKEQLVYLRLWLGIVVVAEISLLGWLASAVGTALPGSCGLQ
jgi:hypothetical protein